MSKKITLTSAKIVSLSKNGNWSQSFSFENIFGVLEINGPEGFETPLLGKNIIEEIQKKYFESEDKNLEFLKEILLFLSKKEDENNKINTAFCLRVGLILYLGTLNKGKILIQREGKLLTILTGEKELETASGFLKDKDRIILETENFSKIIDQEKLNQSFDNRKPQEIADILAPEIQAKEEFGGAGMIIMAEIEEMNEIISEGRKEKEIKIEEKEEEMKEGEENFLERLKSAFLNINQKIKGKLTSISFYRPIYIKETAPREEKKRKLLTTVAFLLIILLIISIFFNLKQKFINQSEKDFNQAYNTAIKKDEEGKALIDLNPIRSRTLFQEAKASLEKVRSSISKNKKLNKKLETTLKEIESNLSIVSKIYYLKELSTFFDLELIKEKAVGKALTIDEENLYIYDNNNQSIYLLNYKNNSQKTLATDKNFEKGTSLASLENNVYLLTDKSVFRIGKDGKEKRAIISLNTGKENIIDFSSFLTNLYLLDIKNSRVWKYVLSESGPVLSNYLLENIKPDLSDGVSITIDGAVYVFKKNGEILKFVQGNLDNFKISGLDITLKNPKKFFTNENLKNIYILDSGNNRIVLINKKGEYQSQYVNEEIGNVEDVVVDGEEKNIYLLSGSKIYEIKVHDGKE